MQNNQFPLPQAPPPGAPTVAQVQAAHAAATAAASTPIPAALPSYALPPVNFSWEIFLNACNPAPYGIQCNCGQWHVKSLPNTLGGCGHDTYGQYNGFTCGMTKDPTGKARPCPGTKDRCIYSSHYVVDLCPTCAQNPQIVQNHRNYVALFDPATYPNLPPQDAQLAATDALDLHHRRFWGLIYAYRQQGVLE